MDSVERFSFTSADSSLGEVGFRPLLPIRLIYGENSQLATALLDTGATVNVLPYGLGLQLGYEWDRQTTSLSLSGNLAQYEARVVVLEGQVGEFEPVRLVFAWTKAETVPLILGQVSFFMEFDVCFYRSQLVFDVRPRSKG
jgi:hypothetical protein